MQALLRVGVRKRLGIAGWIAACSLFAISSPAQRPVARITTVVDDADRTTIYGTHPVMARTEDDAGRVPLGSKFEGISIAFSRTPAQEADLQALLAAQQDPTSPLYAKWLTPDEFGARFGLADSDIAKVQSWLGQHGFTEFSVSRSKNRISFSGTVEQVEAAFGTEMHYYKVNGETHFAPSRDVSVPAALSSVVQTVTNLSSFRPKSHISGRGPRRVVSPDFTSSQSGNHFLTPKDVATIYDINPAYKAGYNGAGQSIAVVGQSAIVLSDIEHFQTAAGFAVKDPTLVLVPNTGTATIRSGDEAESDLDLEYTSTIASGATIYFVYVGNNANSGVFDSIQFAVTNKTAPIISVSYGLCEAALGSSGYSSLNAILAQAASQGQSVIVASGDSGSTDCYGETGLTTAQQQALAVDFPGSSQYVTAIGGTEFPAADVASTNTTYWQAASGSDLVSSALSYIPEQVWNDDSTARLSSSGGGVSTFTPKPSWQTGVPGIPSGTFRLVPDVSLSSSPNNAGYLFCSSDSSNGVTGSCTNGFRDSSNVNLTVAGGTSFAAPVFAGMLALINDKLNSTGQGVINSTLYTLAANSATYASAFHDITSGGNQCTAGTKICSTAGASQYPATSGYDQASGLGSVDLFNLMTAWPGSSSSLVPSKTTLSAATMTPAPGASDAVTITVASGSTSNTATPTGTLTVTVDGTLQTSSLALVSGSATYTFSSTTPGAHVIAATYSGDSTYASSTGSLTVTVPAPVASKTTLSAATSTPAPGASDAISITVASASTSSTTTPTGTVTIAVDGTTQTPTLTLANGSATYTFSSTAAGAHTIAATYSGDSNYASSGGSLTLTVAAKSFKLAASNVTVTAGNPGASTITLTPQNGYTGTVAWTVASSPALTNGCFSIANTTVSGTTAVAATLTVNTVASACAAPALVGAGVDPRNTPGRAPHPYGKDPTVLVALQANQAGMTMVGLLFLGLLGRRCRRLATLATLGILATIGFAASGCAGVGSSMPPPSSPTAARGAYAVTIVGTDTTTSSITASTTLTLTID
jgi:subtilase family serine protease